MVQGTGEQLIGFSQGRASVWILLLLILLALAWWQREWWWGWLPVDRQSATTVRNAPHVPMEGKPIFAWRDDEGRWNYSDVPPADRPYETRQYRDDVNVVPSTPARAD